MSTAQQAVDELRAAFGKGGDFEMCPGGYDECQHTECEVADYVLSVVEAVR